MPGEPKVLGTWNDLVSPQVILDRLTKGVEKGGDDAADVRSDLSRFSRLGLLFTPIVLDLFYHLLDLY